MRSDELADNALGIFDTVLVSKSISVSHPLLKLNGPKLLVHFNYLISRQYFGYFGLRKRELEFLVENLQQQLPFIGVLHVNLVSQKQVGFWDVNVGTCI